MDQESAKHVTLAECLRSDCTFALRLIDPSKRLLRVTAGNARYSYITVPFTLMRHPKLSPMGIFAFLDLVRIALEREKPVVTECDNGTRVIDVVLKRSQLNPDVFGRRSDKHLAIIYEIIGVNLAEFQGCRSAVGPYINSNSNSNITFPTSDCVTNENDAEESPPAGVVAGSHVGAENDGERTPPKPEGDALLKIQAAAEKVSRPKTPQWAYRFFEAYQSETSRKYARARSLSEEPDAKRVYLRRIRDALKRLPKGTDLHDLPEFMRWAHGVDSPILDQQLELNTFLYRLEQWWVEFARWKSSRPKVKFDD